jgi:uncharacterized protein (DUF924 family)
MDTLPADGPGAVLEFWFGTDPDAEFDRWPLWWKKDPAVDQEIAGRFAALRAQAVRGRLGAWEETPGGRLALILLVDQFSRHIFRGLPEAFAHDGLARSWCRAGIDAGQDRHLSFARRTFFYMPLEHSESLADQERCVALFDELLATATPGQRPRVAEALDFARRHRDIIRRFGRFPHRNAILGRRSTPEEAAFLLAPGSGF